VIFSGFSQQTCVYERSLCFRISCISKWRLASFQILALLLLFLWWRTSSGCGIDHDGCTQYCNHLYCSPIARTQRPCLSRFVFLHFPISMRCDSPLYDLGNGGNTAVKKYSIFLRKAGVPFYLRIYALRARWGSYGLRQGTLQGCVSQTQNRSWSFSVETISDVSMNFLGNSCKFSALLCSLFRASTTGLVHWLRIISLTPPENVTIQGLKSLRD